MKKLYFLGCSFMMIFNKNESVKNIIASVTIVFSIWLMVSVLRLVRFDNKKMEERIDGRSRKR